MIIEIKNNTSTSMLYLFLENCPVSENFNLLYLDKIR